MHGIHRNKLAIGMIAFLLYSAGCGSKLPSSEPSSSSTMSTISADASAQSSMRCKLSTPSNEFLTKHYAGIDINQIHAYTADDFPKSLCDIAMDYQADVVIFQFAGVDCLSCQDEAKMIVNKLKITQPFGNKIAHVVLLTDLRTDYTEENFAQFMAQYAPQSIRMHDRDIALWKQFSKDPSAPTRPTLLTYDRRGWSYLINGEDDDPNAIIAAAQSLLANQAQTISSGDTLPKSGPIAANPNNGAASANPGNAGSADIPQNTPQPNQPNIPIPTPSVIPPSIPQIPAPSLSASQNLSLRDAAGQTIALTQFFGNSTYTIIDLSQYNCTYCRQLANSHESDSAYQSMINGGKCKNLTLLPSTDLSLWLQKYPSSGFVGSTSRSVSSVTSVATAFGVAFPGTPTVFVIDRQGRVVAQSVGAMPSEVNQLCR